MKKIMSTFLCLTLFATLCLGMTFSASAAGSAEIDGMTYEWDDEVEFLPAGPGDWEINGGARITGSREEGFTFVDLNSWGANLADTEPWEAEEGWYLYYDIDIESGTMGIRAQWWNCNVGEALVAKHDIEGGGDDGDHLTEGQYVGMLPVEEFADGLNDGLADEETGDDLGTKWLLNIYVVKGKMTINKMKLVHLTSLPTTTTTEEPTTTTEATEATEAADGDTTTTAAEDKPTDEKDEGLSTGVIIAIIAAAVVVIGGVVGGILLAKKKKTPKA